MQLVFPWREYISTFWFLLGINWYAEVSWLGEEGPLSWLLRPGGNLLGATVQYSALSHGYGNNIRGVQRERVPHLR